MFDSFKKAFAAAAAVVVTGAAAVVAIPMITTEEPRACPSSIVIGVGGNQDGQSEVFKDTADIRVQYSGKLNDVERGISALKKEVDDFRAECPDSRLILSGFSQGSAITHVYLSRHGHEIKDNAHAVLYSDPKMHPTGESNGLFLIGGSPVAGTDKNFGGVPTSSICRLDDIICNRTASSGWIGFLFLGNHMRYDFDPRKWDRVVGHHYL